MSLKNPVTPPGIDPGTVRLVAQRLNYYATPDPTYICIHTFITYLLYIQGMDKIMETLVKDTHFFVSTGLCHHFPVIQPVSFLEETRISSE